MEKLKTEEQSKHTGKTHSNPGYNKNKLKKNNKKEVYIRQTRPRKMENDAVTNLKKGGFSVVCKKQRSPSVWPKEGIPIPGGIWHQHQVAYPTTQSEAIHILC